MEKVRHITSEHRKRLCGSVGNYEPSGTDTELPVCPKCAAVYATMTGEVVE